MRKPLALTLLTTLTVALLSSVVHAAVDPASITDKQLTAAQDELLELAFDTATAMPIKPHIKDRSRLQFHVVEASLRLDQPRRALKYIEKIDDWRRGAGYASLALYYVRHGATSGVQHYLDMADQIARGADQDWRRQSIQITIITAKVLLGEHEAAAAMEKGLEVSDTAKVAPTRAAADDEKAFEDQARFLDSLVATAEFDNVKNALEAYVDLYGRFYGNAARRSAIEDKIRGGWKYLPVIIQIDLLLGMSRAGLEHADGPEALRIINDAQKMMDGAEWPLDYYVGLRSRIAALRFSAGDKQRARADADRAGEMFDAEGDKIMGVFQAATLRPLAETYQSMGDADKALAVYTKAVELGAVNPNARPRAEDLASTCVSMALNGVEPGAQLWARVRQIRQGLGNPW